ncbi:TlpA disulfide reductase family protein [Thiohalocapsa marina]
MIIVPATSPSCRWWTALRLSALPATGRRDDQGLNSGPVFGIPALILAALLLILVPAAMAAESDALLTPLSDQPEAPDFELAGPDERIYRLADFTGQPLIVNFWATWCPPCRTEMPSMQRAWEQIEAEGIGMMAINVGEDAETVRAFLEQVPVSFPLPLDTDSKVTQRWPMRGLPTTFVVGPEGRLIYKATGEREWDDPALLEQVRALKTR